MNLTENNWVVIVNVFAASKQAGSVWKKAAALLDEAAITYTVHFTGGVDNAYQLSYKAAADGFRRFIAVGGDGTIHDVLNGMAMYASEKDNVRLSDFTLAVLPVGSGNDWIRSTKVPRDIKAAIKLIADGCRTSQDVVQITNMDTGRDTYMVNIGGIGLDARVAEIVNKKKEQGKRGKILYLKALLYCIRHRVPVRAKVICDGEVVYDGKYLSMAFGIGKYSGGGMRQTSLAVMNDGLLDVTIIPDISLWVIARKVPTLFTGTFHKVDVLTQARCREVVVLPYGHADAEPVEVDGEIVGRVPVKMTVLPDQLNIISPLIPEN